MGLKRVSWVRRYQGQCRALRPLGHQGCRLRNHKKDQPLCSGYMVAVRNLRQEWRGTNHGTHQPHPHPHQRQPPAGPSHTPTHTHAHTNIHGRHTHTHATTTNPRHAHQHRHHARTHRATNTHTTRKPPPNPTERATAAAGGPQPGVAGNRNQDHTQEWQATTHHRRQRTPGRSGKGPHPGRSARSGKEHPPPPAAKPSQEWRENARRNLRQEWRGTAHNTHQPHPHPHLHQQQAPARETNRHMPHTRQQTPKAHPHPYHRHKHTTHTPARAAPQTQATRDSPHQTPQKRPPPQPADPSQEWRGTAPRTLSQEWRGTTHHQHQRAPSQEWRGTAPGALRQEWRGNAHPEPTAGSEGPRPANRRTSARSGEGPPRTNTRGPQPGVAGSRTQDPQPGVVGDHPPPPAANRNQGRRGHAHKQLGQEWRGAASPPPPPHPTQGRWEAHHHKPHSERGGRDERVARETQARDPNSRILGPPPVIVSAPPEHTQ